MQFYLGTHMVNWLGLVDVPLFVSHRRLRDRKKLPRAIGPWALDSGGFTELAMYGGWQTPVDEYVEAVHRYQREIGSLAWASPMDWMSEPAMLQRTGLSVREHQERTVQNYLDLRGRGPFVPVLQGWTLNDYERCVDLYASAGVDVLAQPFVAIGSVCRRQSRAEIGQIMAGLQPIRMHAFGVKTAGISAYGHLLASSDSLAWSYRARRSPRLPGCTHRGKCTNCLRFALRWRQKIIDIIDRPRLF
jgi:hypothetical protein